MMLWIHGDKPVLDVPRGVYEGSFGLMVSNVHVCPDVEILKRTCIGGHELFEGIPGSLRTATDADEALDVRIDRILENLQETSRGDRAMLVGRLA